MPNKNSCTHLQADNRVLVKVLGMHAQVVTKPSFATSGQLTKINTDTFHKILLLKIIVWAEIVNYQPTINQHNYIIS